MRVEGIYLPILISLISAIIIGLVLWFIKKKEKLRVWFPILKIFPRKKFRLFSFSVERPPILLVLSYLGIGLILIFLSLSPHELKYVSIVKNGTVHLVADFSPSVQAHIGIEDYRT